MGFHFVPSTVTDCFHYILKIMCVVPVFHGHEMCYSEERFHHNTILIWFVNFIRKASLYQKLEGVHTPGAKLIKSMFVQYWLLMPLRIQVESWSIGRVIVKSTWYLNEGSFLISQRKEQNSYILYKTTHLMMMNKKTQERAYIFFSSWNTCQFFHFCL